MVQANEKTKEADSPGFMMEEVKGVEPLASKE